MCSTLKGMKTKDHRPTVPGTALTGGQVITNPCKRGLHLLGVRHSGI